MLPIMSLLQNLVTAATLSASPAPAVVPTPALPAPTVIVTPDGSWADVGEALPPVYASPVAPEYGDDILYDDAPTPAPVVGEVVVTDLPAPIPVESNTGYIGLYDPSSPWTPRANADMRVLTCFGSFANAYGDPATIPASSLRPEYTHADNLIASGTCEVEVK